MGRHAANVVAANVEAIRKRIKDHDAPSRKEWRIKGTKLVLVTYPTNRGAFYFYYRPKDSGRERKLKLGDFGSGFSLADAKMALAAAENAVQKGDDPHHDRQTRKKATSFQQMAEDFLTTPTLAPRTADTYAPLYKNDIFPRIGSKPAAAVTRQDVIAICNKIEDRGATRQADIAKAAIGGAFRYGRKRGIVDFSPTRDLPNRHSNMPRERTPTDDELSALWKAANDPNAPGTAAMLIAVKLIILTGLRVNEVAGAHEREFNGDVWTLPGNSNVRGKFVRGRTKNGFTHYVYLSAQAKTLVDQARRDYAFNGYLFPGERGVVHYRVGSVSSAFTDVVAHAGIMGLTAHDMRRALSNWAKDADYSSDVRDLLENHREQSVDARHYSNSARMEKQCREAWQGWADHVEAVGT